MNTFDERRSSEEQRFALEGERNFRVRVERDRRIAAWAAEGLGIPAAERPAFIEAFVRENVGRSDEAAAGGLLARFAAERRPMEIDRLLRKLASAQAEAERLR